jgi:hypothetical protein
MGLDRLHNRLSGIAHPTPLATQKFFGKCKQNDCKAAQRSAAQRSAAQRSAAHNGGILSLRSSRSFFMKTSLLLLFLALALLSLGFFCFFYNKISYERGFIITWTWFSSSTTSSSRDEAKKEKEED